MSVKNKTLHVTIVIVTQLEALKVTAGHALQLQQLSPDSSAVWGLLSGGRARHAISCPWRWPMAMVGVKPELQPQQINLAGSEPINGPGGTVHTCCDAHIANARDVPIRAEHAL